MSDVFTNVPAERGIMSAILQYGRDAFVDMNDLLTVDDFSVNYNQALCKCAEDFYETNTDRRLDIPTLESVAHKLGLTHVLFSTDGEKHLRALKNNQIDLKSVRPLAKKIYKLNVAKNLDSELADARKSLHGITGDESLDEIIAMAENPLFDFTAKLNGEEEGVSHIAKGGRDWLQNVIDNPCETIGIPTPYPIYNRRIGGGYRRRSVHMVAARPKEGKSSWADNVALHVAGTLNIPTFNLDTEMSREQHLARILAMLTGIDSFDIERGYVSKQQADLLMEKMEWLESIPYFYESVIESGFEEQIASMRRWVVKHVGTDANGRIKDGLIVYDYLQLTDADEYDGDFKEYQILGFHMMGLLRLAKRCDIPILSLLQTNRSGVDRVSTDIASGSDRIIWKCTDFSVIQRKSFDEIAADGPDEGNTKLFNVITRFGPRVNPQDYINMQFDTEYSRLTEKKTRDEVFRDRGSGTQKGFVCEFDPNESFELVRGQGGSEHAGGTDVLQDRGVPGQPKRKAVEKRKKVYRKMPGA
jgi:replicative DNA helicase